MKAFVGVVSKFDESRREEVRKMGFGGLLEMKLKKLPRNFCYWLLTRLGVDGVVEFGDGKLRSFCAEEFHRILGLPNGDKEVPFEVDYENVVMVEKSQEILTRFGKNLDKPREEVVLLRPAVQACVGQRDDEGGLVPLSTNKEKKDFRAAFLIIVLGHILCPTTMSTNLSSQ